MLPHVVEIVLVTVDYCDVAVYVTNDLVCAYRYCTHQLRLSVCPSVCLSLLLSISVLCDTDHQSVHNETSTDAVAYLPTNNTTDQL